MSWGPAWIQSEFKAKLGYGMEPCLLFIHTPKESNIKGWRTNHMQSPRCRERESKEVSSTDPTVNKRTLRRHISQQSVPSAIRMRGLLLKKATYVRIRKTETLNCGPFEYKIK